jgi:hypothetical protein
MAFVQVEVKMVAPWELGMLTRGAQSERPREKS